MLAKCTGIIPIIPYLLSASGMKIGAVYERVYGFTDLRGRPAGRGRSQRASPNQVTAGLEASLEACESNSADARRSFAQAKLDARLQPLLQQQQARKPNKP